jgi:putative membrane protein
MRPLSLAVLLTGLLLPASAWAQERSLDWHWDMHPVWWPFAALAASLLPLILFGWVLLNLAPLILGVVAAVLGIRWLTKTGRASRHDPAIAVLRERYARGEISREEFEAKLKDLESRP